MEENPPIGAGDPTAPTHNDSKAGLGKILLSATIIWVALDVCVMFLGATGIGWLQNIGFDIMFFSLIGIPILSIGSFIAFVTEPKRTEPAASGSKKSLYVAVAIAFAVCALVVLIGLIYGLRGLR